MEKPINERWVKLSSKVLIPASIELGEDVEVFIKGNSYIFNCVTTQDKDLQDGTIDKIYTLKSLTE